MYLVPMANPAGPPVRDENYLHGIGGDDCPISAATRRQAANQSPEAR